MSVSCCFDWFMMLASVDTYDYIVILSNLSTKET